MKLNPFGVHTYEEISQVIHEVGSSDLKLKESLVDLLSVCQKYLVGKEIPACHDDFLSQLIKSRDEFTSQLNKVKTNERGSYQIYLDLIHDIVQSTEPENTNRFFSSASPKDRDKGPGSNEDTNKNTF